MSDCEQIWERVTDALEYGRGDFAERFASARTHARECPACADRLTQLARALQTSNPATCAESRSWLEQLIHTRQFDEPLAWNLEMIAEHLTGCSECATLAETLRDLLAHDASAPPPRLPTWNLAFLASAPTRALWQSTGANLQRLTQSLDLAWHNSALTLTTVAPVHQVSATPRAQHIRLPDAIAGYTVELDVRADAKGRTTLAARIAEDASGKIISDARLILADPAQPTRIFQRVTGHTRVPVRVGKSLLRLQVGAHQWEIPFNLDMPATRRASGGHGDQTD